MSISDYNYKKEWLEDMHPPKNYESITKQIYILSFLYAMQKVTQEQETITVTVTVQLPIASSH